VPRAQPSKGSKLKQTANPGAGQAAAIGLRAHSGWAALVTVGGSLGSPAVLDRRRIVLADAAVAGSKQPYHAAEGLPFEAAARLVARCRESSAELARRAVGEAVDDLTRRGHKPVAVALLLASGRPLPGLAAILASHALIHTAEGEMFREVLAAAGEHYGLRVVKVKERELASHAAAAFGIAAGELAARLTAIGKPLGAPWRQDEKHAALAGWLALAFH
jgi:hypothetical protein